jgi:hypothetical protein
LKIHAYRVSKEKHKNRPFAISRGRWKNKFKMNLAEIRLEVWIGLIWLRMGTSDGLL